MKIFCGCTLVWTTLLWLLAPHVIAEDNPPATEEITLELITSDPDWIGRTPKDPYWADDGNSFYYEQKREGEEGSHPFKFFSL